MTLVLVILVLLWVAVLLPPFLRGRVERRPADSISTFRRQLTTLRRARPGVPPARHLGSRARGGTVVNFQPRPPARRPAGRAPVGRAPVGRPPAPSGPARRPASARSATYRPSSRSVKRRRDIFVALVTASLATLALGTFGPGMRFMLLVHLLSDVLLGAYVALLLHQRNLMAEREMKVRFLPRPQPVQPALLRRSVN